MPTVREYHVKEFRLQNDGSFTPIVEEGYFPEKWRCKTCKMEVPIMCQNKSNGVELQSVHTVWEHMSGECLESSTGIFPVWLAPDVLEVLNAHEIDDGYNSNKNPLRPQVRRQPTIHLASGSRSRFAD